MKRKLTIVLTKQDIYDEVQKQTAYAGLKDSEDGVAYGHEFVKDSQTEFLDANWDQAVDAISMNVRRYLDHESRETGHAIYDLEMPWNWTESLESGIESDCRQYVISFITGMWMRLIVNSREDKFLSDANGLLLQIRTKLNTRKRPTNPWDPDKKPHRWNIGDGNKGDDIGGLEEYSQKEEHENSVTFPAFHPFDGSVDRDRE